MAIELTRKFHPELAAVPLYVVIDSVTISRTGGGAALGIAVFASKERRELRKAALADIVRLTPLCEAPTPLADDASDKDKADFKVQMDAITIASAEMAVAQNTYNSVQPIAPPNISSHVNVPLPAIPGLLDTAGVPDLAKCYAWLTTQPEFKGDEA